MTAHKKLDALIKSTRWSILEPRPIPLTLPYVFDLFEHRDKIHSIAAMTSKRIGITISARRELREVVD
jgi:hypothetical protein